MIFIALKTVSAMHFGSPMMSVSQGACHYVAMFVRILRLSAPLGYILGSHLHRIVLADIVIVLDIVALVGAYFTIQMFNAMWFVENVRIFCVSLQNQLENLKSGRLTGGQMAAQENCSTETDENDEKSNNSKIGVTVSKSHIPKGFSKDRLNRLW